MRSNVQLCKLVHRSGVYCHMHTSSTSGCVFVYFTAQSTECVQSTHRVCKEYIFISNPACLEASIKAIVMQLVLYCTFPGSVYQIKNVFFIFCVCLFSIYYLCEKYYKPITVQYHIANCVSWAPRLTLQDLQTNWTYKHALRMELVHAQGTYCNKTQRSFHGTMVILCYTDEFD